MPYKRRDGKFCKCTTPYFHILGMKNFYKAQDIDDLFCPLLFFLGLVIVRNTVFSFIPLGFVIDWIINFNVTSLLMFLLFSLLFFRTGKNPIF